LQKTINRPRRESPHAIAAAEFIDLMRRRRERPEHCVDNRAAGERQKQQSQSSICQSNPSSNSVSITVAGPPDEDFQGRANSLKRLIAKLEGKMGAKMTEEKRAELYTNPGGKFIRADNLSRILAHWRSFRRAQKLTHFIK
jgi:hypothetical protein